MTAPHCPQCKRLLNLSSRISGDVIWCACGVYLRIRWIDGGVVLHVQRREPAP